MNNSEHRKFCEKLGNKSYELSDKTKENQNDFFNKQLGISREDVLELETDEFDKLVESRKGTKIGYDRNITIEGCKLTTLDDKER